MGPVDGTPVDPADVGAYCRQVEAYLCARNGGHLVRIAGPSFDRVCGWAARGIPLSIVFRGIDRRVERDAAKGPRRRPVLIDFCEADVLDVFDEWRRAVGVAAWSGTGSAAEAEAPPRGSSLPRHLERVIARLATARTAGSTGPALRAAIDDSIRKLDGMRAGSKALRGRARDAARAELDEIDRALAEAARADTAPAEWTGIRRQAALDLEPFRARMAPEAFGAAVDRGADRLLRQQRGLPVVTFEP